MPHTRSHYIIDGTTDPLRANPVLRGLLVLLRALASFALTFIELVSEIVAPLLLIAGAVWWAALRIAGSIAVEPEIGQILQYLPAQFRLGDHWLTPDGLIRQGLLLLAVVAACRTLNRLIAREI